MKESPVMATPSGARGKPSRFEIASGPAGPRNDKGCRFFSLCLTLLVIIFLIDAAGCSPEWKKKFTRPRKKVQATQPILVLESDEKAMYPPETRYRQHYAFWKSWHSDLLDSYGQLRKRDVRYLSGSIGELRAMAELLQGPPADEMKEILIRLTEIEDRWRTMPEPWNPPATTRTELDKLRRQIEKKLQYGKVKKWIVSGTSSSAKP